MRPVLRKVQFPHYPTKAFFHCFSTHEGRPVAILEQENGNIMTYEYVNDMKFVERFRGEPTPWEKLMAKLGKEPQ